MIETNLQLPPTIAANINVFTGRTWLLPEIIEWYYTGSERVFLLTGGPGTGKSMILAWLAGAGPPPSDPAAAQQLARLRSQAHAIHFCLARTRSNSPSAFAESVANQLTRHVPGFGDALAKTLADRVQIGAMQAVGKVESGGTVTGVSIDHLDLGTLGDELSFDRAFAQPLKKLYELGYDRPVLVLVDALDEAEIYDGKKLSILLASLDDLPSQVRLIVSMRRDDRILKYYRTSRQFDLIEDAPPNADDVRTYALGRLSKVDGLGAGSAETFASRIATAAKGTFLYASIVLEEVLPRLPGLTDLDLADYPLPDGLSGLYHDFLNRELGQNAAEWYSSFKPLLGLIAVAQGQGLTATQLAAMSGKEVEWPLLACQQYLVGERPEGPFTIFHKSFADYLLEDSDNSDYHIDAAGMHRQIADYFLTTYGGRWHECSDQYALAHTASHLVEVARQAQDPQRRDQYHEKLAWLLSAWSFLEAKAAQLGLDGLLADLRAAAALEMGQAGAPLDPGELVKVLEWEDATLAGWDQQMRPALFAQQVHNRGKEMGLPGMAAAAEVRLRELGHPYLDQRWRVWPDHVPDGDRDAGGGWWLANTVSALAVVPGGRTAVSAHLDSTLQVWDVATGRRMHTLRGHEAAVFCVAAMPDGRGAVSGSQDGTVRVWDVATGRMLHTMVGHEGSVFAVRVTPDGRRALSRADDGLLRVWDLRSGKALHALGVPEPPYFFTFAVDDQLADDIPTLIYGIAEYALAVTPEGQRAISAMRNVLILWDLETGHEVHRLEGHEEPVISVAVSEDGRWAVSASHDKTARVWDLDTGRLVHTLGGHRDWVQAVLVTGDDHRVISASLDGTARLWDLSTGRLLRTFSGPGREWHRLDALATGCVVGVDQDGYLAVWNLDSGREHPTTYLAGGLPQIAVDRTSDTIVAGMSNGSLYCLRYVLPA